MVKLIKKYTNRRLYDTDDSRYITLDELAELIRKGHDVKVIDAQSDQDLTQATLAQIVVESRGAAKLLPVPLLTQMVRMEDDALAEFMSLYLTWSLDIYYAMKQARVATGADAYQEFLGRYAQMATMPLSMARGGLNLVRGKLKTDKDLAENQRDEENEIDSLRDEINELKELIKGLADKPRGRRKTES